MKKNTMTIAGVALVLALSACGAGVKKTQTQQADIPSVQVPAFNADSAYLYVAEQVNFGPRVPNTSAHVSCGDYLEQRLASFGAKVTSQRMDLVGYDGGILKARNIIGAYKPELKKRIALFAHWDSRPWADNDPDEKNHHTPVLGANDGASGVGVLLEIARQLQQQSTELGIDIIFLDAEDAGNPQFDDSKHSEETWCLGAQYWARVPHIQGYNARFGILLDMVGGAGATFYQESTSMMYAKEHVKKVWKAAKRLGFGKFFIAEEGGGVTDDHLFINRIAKIPTLDIVPNQMDAKLSSFGDRWHTVNDTMEGIDRSTLGAVGQTVMEVIYNEK